MIYVTGDLHGSYDIRKLSSEFFPEGKGLTRNNHVIVCGDFGMPWDNSKSDGYWLDWLEAKPWTTLFVDGNHENFDLLDAMPVEEWNGGKIHRVRPNIIHLMRGQVFTIDGKKFFTFGGAESIDKARRRAHISWWSQEMPSASEYEEGLANLDKHEWKVDYVITHTCSVKAFYELEQYMITKFDKVPTAVEKYFDVLEEKLEYKQWYFGHYHDNGDFDDKHTVLYWSMKVIE